MPPSVDLSGKKFERLTAVGRIGSKCGHALWICRCECGKTTEAMSCDLKSGKVKSCGCLNDEARRKNSKKGVEARRRQLLKHGCSGDRLYSIWKSMRERCNTSTSGDYPEYGGRGISVCEEWGEYPPFRDWAMKNGYDENAPFGKCTLDRIDVNGNYEPSNCRFVDLKVQANNRRRRSCRSKSQAA